jgi:hypothetical protein
MINRNYIIPAVVLLGALAVACMLIWGQVQAPITYTEQTYPPNKPAYQPGETMVFTPTLFVRSGSGDITLLASLWSITRDQPARLCDGTRALISWPSYDPPFHVRGTKRGRGTPVDIPRLPNGEYIFKLTAKQELRRPTSFEVRFRVVNSCGG